MVRRAICCLATLGAVLLIGCGGGGGSSSNSRDLVRKRAIATTRLNHATFALAGLGMHVSRVTPNTGPGLGLGRRAAVMLPMKVISRAADAFDADTKLYYQVTTDSTGAGTQSLFTDSARTVPAGNFTWGAPQWTGSTNGTYPASFHSTYTIIAGDLKGMHGNLDFTTQDSTAARGTMHVTVTTSDEESVTGDFTIADGMVLTGTQQVRLPDKTSYEEQDTTFVDGRMSCMITFSDGSKETIIMQADGSGTETYTNSSGSTELTGTFDEETFDTFDYGDGSTEDIDTDFFDDTFDDLWSDSSWDELMTRAHKKPHKAVKIKTNPQSPTR